MTTQSSWACPRCQQLLASGTYYEVPIDLCTQCNGLMVEQARLVDLLQAVVDDLDVEFDAEAVLEPVPDAGSDNPCPRCLALMDNYGYMETRFVMIDACRNCMVLWIDADELGPMSWIHARSRMRAEHIQKKTKEFQDDIARRTKATLDSRAMANRIASSMM